MKTIILMIFSVVMLMTMSSCTGDLTETDKNRFKGLWRLVVIEEQNPESGDWGKWRKELQGYLLYDEENSMAIHLTSKGYQNTDISFHDFIDTVSIEELRHRTQSYVYFAKYTINEKNQVVEHARISHSNPNEWNKVVKRKYEFSSDTLILTTIGRKNTELRVKWIKF